ncbi:MAG: MerR family transcriptional regulator [Erysipelothrix sp.]
MKIKEVSELTKMSADTLRYYEKEGLIGPIPRINKVREYREEDVNRIIFIQHMRTAGMKIGTLKEYLEMVDAGESTQEDRLEVLEKHRDNLISEIHDLEKILNVIDVKIANYHSRLSKKEKELKNPHKS